MRFMYNKKTLEGIWFYEIEDTDTPDDTTGYTEKRPPDTSYIWDDTTGDWIKPLQDAEITIEPESAESESITVVT